MKVFISHASANKQYGSALVELLTGLGVPDADIIFTSNPAYGIPIGKNIFDWLKSQIAEKNFVVFLLSEEYYRSIACLNEMGAAWVVENEHAVVFLPGFEVGGKDFQNGAIDPRSIGFHINDKDRVLQFINSLKTHFSITDNMVILVQKVDRFLAEVNSIVGNLKPVSLTSGKVNVPKSEEESRTEIEKTINQASLLKQHPSLPSPSRPKGSDIYNTFLKDADKFTDLEFLLLHYLTTTAKTRLLCGWQADHEISNIVEWENIHQLNNKLSQGYESVLRRFIIRGFIQVSAVTGSDKPKEYQLKDEIAKNILDLPTNLLERIQAAVSDNPVSLEADGDLPF